MSKLNLRNTLFSAVLFVLSANSFAEKYVYADAQPHSFPLHRAAIYLDSNGHSGVQIALKTLRSDLKKVTGAKLNYARQASNLSEYLIVAGTSQNTLIQTLVDADVLDVEPLKGVWEGFKIKVVNAPFPGVKQALVIVGSDPRGAIFGIYDLAEQSGVSPWYWWADVPIKKSKQLFIPSDTEVFEKPAVKYRGIFLNDEAPALSGWVKENFGNYNAEFYQHVFELLLRLKANYLWPAMWNNAFNLDDPNNRVLAHNMGIVMGTSHHEPMARAHKEWTWRSKEQKGNGEWNYLTNKNALSAFWQEGIAADKPYESITTLGMRGDGDEPMSAQEDIHLLESIISDQRDILADVYQRSAKDIPQVWTLYKEVQGYYDKGMRVPDDVTLLWADDNWGNIRRLPTKEERSRSGGAGVYYHFDYVGGPRSYRWINTIPIAKVWHQMDLAYRYGADRIWIVNVGDLKPMEFPMDFFLRMAWNPVSVSRDTLSDFGERWAAQQFGHEYAKDIASLIDGYTQHNGRRKPELMDANTYSQVNYGEADRIQHELKALEAQADVLQKKLPANLQDAYFQLVLYPLKASVNLFELYDNVAKNRLYAKQGRATTNFHAKKVEEHFQYDQFLADKYHQLGRGRWNHFLSQPRIGYTHWNNPPENTQPYVVINKPISSPDMGVAIEGSEQWWPETKALSLGEFSLYGVSTRFIDVYNRGTKPFSFRAEVDSEWVSLSSSGGEVRENYRISVTVDWNKVPEGLSKSTIKITGTGWDGAYIHITARNPEGEMIDGFVETEGYISINATSAVLNNNQEEVYWATIPGYGREGKAMAAFAPPDADTADVLSAPYLEFPLHTQSSGDFTLHLLVAPTLNFMPRKGLRIGLAFDDETPQIIDLFANNSEEAWAESVKNAVRKVSVNHSFAHAGSHTLKVFLIDQGVVLEKVVLDFGGLKKSYLGPQESAKINN